MLTIIIPGEEELFDEAANEFISVGETTVDFEHSLVSLSKWESKFEKPFLSSTRKTDEEIAYYIQCMVISPGVSLEKLSRLTKTNAEEINAYIDSSQTATTFGRQPEKKVAGEVITTELIYYWMVTFNIPFECEHWHVNRLFALIRVCNAKNQKPKKMSRAELARQNKELNDQRRAQMNSNG